MLMLTTGHPGDHDIVILFFNCTNYDRSVNDKTVWLTL